MKDDWVPVGPAERSAGEVIRRLADFDWDRHQDDEPPARVMDAYRARFGDLGGGTA